MALSKGLLKQQEPIFYIDKEWLYQKYYIENLSLHKISVLIGSKSNDPIIRHMKLYGFKIKTNNQYPRIIKQRTYVEIDKEWLYQKYLVEKMSASKISNLLEVSCFVVLKRLKEHGIPLRTRSEEFSGERNPVYGIRGEAHHAYKADEDRIGPLIKLIRNYYKTTFWRKEILKRDNFKCTNTNCNSTEKLHVDHIESLALIIVKWNISTLEEAKKCPILWDINNGRVLCEKCHHETDTWGSGTKKLVKEHQHG